MKTNIAEILRKKIIEISQWLGILRTTVSRLISKYKRTGEI